MEGGSGMEANIARDAKKIVIKIGSSTLTSPDGSIDKGFLDSFASQVKALMDQGKKVILVSSGAGAAGANTIGKWSRKEDLHYKQALCAIGQVELMDSYRRTFDQYGIHIAQILLTKEDFDSSQRTMNIRNTLFTLLDEGVVPIVNENDTVSTDEIKIGDNDILAANTSVVWGADLLVLLSRIRGIYDSDPTTHGDAQVIPVIDDIDVLEEKLSSADPESTKAGGIKTKLKAARLANKYGIPMIVIHGKTEDVISRITEGDFEGTLFAPISR